MHKAPSTSSRSGSEYVFSASQKGIIIHNEHKKTEKFGVCITSGAILTHTPTRHLVKVTGDVRIHKGELVVPIRFVDIDGEQFCKPNELSPDPPKSAPSTARLRSIFATKAKYISTIASYTHIQKKNISRVQHNETRRLQSHRVAKLQACMEEASVEAVLLQQHEFYKLAFTTACILSVICPVVPTRTVQSQRTCTATLATVNSISIGLETKDNKIFLIDTGSQAHTTPTVDDFVDGTYHKYSTPEFVHDAGEGKHAIEGMGDVRQRIRTTDGVRDIVYKGVMHVPSFPLRILSASKIRSDGFGIRLPSGSPGYIEISGGHRAFFTPKDGLEFVCGCTNPPAQSASGITVSSVRIPRKAIQRFNAWVQGATPEEIIQRLGTPFPDDNEYHIRRLREQLATQAVYTPATTNAAVDGFLQLHARLGHAGAAVVSRFAREHLPNSAYRALGSVAIKYCEACQRSKSIHRPVPKIRTDDVDPGNGKHKRQRTSDRSSSTETRPQTLLPTATQPWNYFSVDIVEQGQTSLLGNNRYCLIAVDHYSNAIRIYGLVNIRDVESPLREHFLWVRKHHAASIPNLKWDWEQTDSSAIHMKSDGASVFSTLSLRMMYSTLGVSHSRSAPHQQSRNGRCERAVRTCKHQAAALRAARGLSNTFWLLAWRHAAYVHNYLPTKSNPEAQSPNQMCGISTDIGHLHIFGADAWITREKPQLGQDRGLPGMYVGYNEDGMEHLILVPPSRGGPEELLRFQTVHPNSSQHPDNAPIRHKVVLRRVAPENVTIDPRVPSHVLDGTVRPASDLYVPYDDGDDDTLIIIGESATTVPPEDRNQYDHDVLDLDYHLSHCISAPASCTCMGYRGEMVDGQPTLTRCTAVIIDPAKHNSVPMSTQTRLNSKQQSPEFAKATWDSVAGLFHHPRVLAVGECNTYKEAMLSDNAALYEGAKDKEQEQLLNLDTGVLKKCKWSEIPAGEKLFPSMMRFIIKRDENNAIRKAKARWCFRGDKQIHHEHYEDASANCPRWSTIRLFMANAARLGRKIKVGDVTGAFLKGTDPNGQTLWMRAPPGLAEYDSEGKEMVYQVTGNMYGMKQAPNIWMNYLNEWLETKDFIRSKADPCVFTRRKYHSTLQSDNGDTTSTTSTGIGGVTPPSTGAVNNFDEISLLVYVDDLAYHGSSAAIIEEFEAEFQKKFGDVGCHYPNLYLGANITQDAVGLHLSNRAMIERMRDQYFPSKGGTKVPVSVFRSSTPFPSNGSALGGEVLLKDCPDLANGEPPITAPYSELVGSLSYCALTCRPDIAFYTSQLARVQSAPGEVHFKLAKRVLRYLIQSKDHGIRYYKRGKGLFYYTDSSWADVTPQYVEAPDGAKRTIEGDDGRRSSYGYVGYYASGPITWCSRIHKERRTLSSMEAELIAGTEAAKDLLHITYVAKDLLIEVPKGIPLFEDNQSVLALCLRTGITKRSKHIEVRWFLLRDLQGPTATPGQGVLLLQYKNTKQQVADIFTKSTTQDIFTSLRTYLVRTPEDQALPPADLGMPTTTA
jgi:hypothetical protein